MSATASVLLRHAESDDDLRACFPVLKELRPHLNNAAQLVAALRQQTPQGYRILAAWEGDQAKAVAGYRVQDNLIHGHFLYVDDLATLEQSRSQGLGGKLLSALEEIAVQQQCKRLVLDTALANSRAQRFYFRSGLLARGYHFSVDL